MNKSALMLVIAAAAATAGCATKEYVREQVTPVSKRVDGLEGDLSKTSLRVDNTMGEVKKTNDRLGEFIKRLDENEAANAQASKTAQEALQRAEAAGKLAEGKLVYEMSFSEKVMFKFESNDLTDEAKAALEAFAEKLKVDNRNVFIEIQGHTDNTGPEALNMKLGEDRAESVRRHLAMKGGIPLHRMSVISYGESEPVADNKTRKGRSENRRVVLVVLQ
jgi:peptidoglycan-associated lipoprotein